MFDKYLEFLKEIIAIDTVEAPPSEDAPFGQGNKKCLDSVLKKAEELGFSTKNGNGYYGFAEVGEGDLFGILGHLDTVPFGDGWTKNPLGEIDDGIFYGRGVMDDKGPILAALFAAGGLLKDCGTPKKRIRLIFGCNEESRWECMDSYIKHEEIPVSGFSPDSDFPVINCEKGTAYFDMSVNLPKGIKSIYGGVRANMVMDFCECVLDDGRILKTNGKSAHGSHPEQGESAFIKMLELLKTEAPDAFCGLYEKLSDYNGSGIGLAVKDAESGKLTFNVGVIKTENGKAVLSFDFRFPVTYEREYVKNQLQKALPEYELKQIGGHDSLYFPPDHPLVNNLLDAYRTVTGDKKAQPLSIGGATYARAMPECVAFGPQFPGTVSTIHQPDEHASLKDLEAMYGIYQEAIKRLCY